MKGLSSGKAQKIYPGKWTLTGKRSELQQKLREFVEEAGLFASLCQRGDKRSLFVTQAKAALKGLEEAVRSCALLLFV